VAVGDVAGHGVVAAAVMGQVRNALRAFVVDGTGPAATLSKLDALVQLADGDLIATVVLGRFDPATGALEWASAGHPPPYLFSGGKGRFLDEVVGAPLGAGRHDDYVEQHLELSPGDVLVAYTDGLVERRGESLALGLDRLAAAVTRAERTQEPWAATDLVDRLLTGLPRFDDVCALTLRPTTS
jgi:serine phosphatase RsbU (regulator of sigma subunit)